MTGFGRLSRILRIKNDMLLKDLSEHIGITLSHLSAIEIGKRMVTPKILKKYQEFMKLSDKEYRMLRKAALEQRKEYFKDKLKKLEEEFKK